MLDSLWLLISIWVSASHIIDYSIHSCTSFLYSPLLLEMLWHRLDEWMLLSVLEELSTLEVVEQRPHDALSAD